MDYKELAKELIDIQGLLLQIPAKQKLSKLHTGSLFALYYLAQSDHTVHPKELSEKLVVSTARIASLLNYLEEKGMVQRQVDPEDKRQICVVLTESGRYEIHRVCKDALPSLCDMLEKLGPEDAEAYIRIQKKIWNNFQAYK